MGQIPSDDFSYKNLIKQFFVNNKLINDHKERVEKCFQFVAKNVPPLSVRARASITKSIKSVETTFLKRWRALKPADLQHFQNENEKWVHTVLQLPSSVTSGNKRAVPKKKNFDELSQRQKNRRAEDLIGNGIELLLIASAEAAKNANKMDLKRILRLLSKDHQIATKILTLLESEKSFRKPEKIVPLRGLTYLLDSNQSKVQYLNTRLLAKEQGADIFPSYNKILDAKKQCRPLPVYMIVNDISAHLPLQQLLNHTANRLLLLQEEVVKTLNGKNGMKLKLQIKWGVDGSSNYSQYNQKYLTEGEDSNNSDASLFATTLVPLRMTTVDNANNLIWNNSTPQSPRWCRPLRLHFAKETKKFTISEIRSVQREIEALSPFVSIISGVTITIDYEMYLTMIDGKVLAVETNTKSNQRCCICKATPTQFNNLDNMEIRFKPEEGSLNYGLSVLHLWIRSFEWLLHLSYRKDIGAWQVRGSVSKKIVAERKLKLQSKFWDNFKLRVDFPSPGGSGNSNNGNVCRKAFSDPDLLSTTLELDKELVKRIRIILIALSCQLPLDAERYHEYCIQTARHYLVEYSWFPFPPTVHKALIHGRDIMLANDLPVGVLAEDAAESCHKLYRNNRQFHARKDNRQHTLTDIFNRALDSSDPIVASFGLHKRQKYKKRMKLPDEVLRLLRLPDVPQVVADELEEDEDSDSSPDSTVMDEILEGDFDELNLPEDPFYSSDTDD